MKPSNKIVIALFQLLFFSLLGYALLYFSYKYYSPFSMGTDFISYYEMTLNPWDYSVAQSPFIYRQFGTFMSAVIYQSGIYYPLDLRNPLEGIDQQVYFSMLLSNFLALILTAFVTARTVMSRQASTFSHSLLAGCLVLLSFGSLVFVLTGLLEGWTWFLVALAFWAIRKKNHGVLILALVLSIFQKETIPIIISMYGFFMGLLAYKNKENFKFHLSTFIYGTSAFVVYLVIRTFVIKVAGFESHLQADSLFSKLFDFEFTAQIWSSTIISQNMIYLVLSTVILMVILKKSLPNLKFNMAEVGVLLVISVALYIIGMATGIGNNIGRILLELTPVWAYLFITLLIPIESSLQAVNQPQRD